MQRPGPWPTTYDPKSNEHPFRWADITWLLHKHHVSWAYYVGPDTCLDPGCQTTGSEKTPGLFIPIAGFRTVAYTGQTDNIRTYPDFFTRASDVIHDFILAALLKSTADASRQVIKNFAPGDALPFPFTAFACAP